MEGVIAYGMVWVMILTQEFEPRIGKHKRIIHIDTELARNTSHYQVGKIDDHSMTLAFSIHNPLIK
jgi:hypothetical protein